MAEFRLLQPDDSETIANIIRTSNDLLAASPTIQRNLDGKNPRYTDMGRYGLCLEASDAVTRAAHKLGVVASRQPLEGFHFITSFAPPEQAPQADDLIMDRTWSQYHPDIYHLPHKRSFVGARGELEQVSPDAALRFKPESVIYSQVVHADVPENGSRPPWLNTTHEELAGMGYVMGKTEISLPSLDDFERWL